MIKINSQELRDAVQALYEFDKEHSVLIDRTERVTGDMYHETYEFDGRRKVYYFDSSNLFAFEDVE